MIAPAPGVFGYASVPVVDYPVGLYVVSVEFKIEFSVSLNSVFGMQELIAQSSPDRCLDSIPQTVQLHDVKRGVKSTGQ